MLYVKSVLRNSKIFQIKLKWKYNFSKFVGYIEISA